VSASRRIANRFEIRNPEHDLLGRGSMGDVYRATDTHTGELVAVKALDPGILERFVREGEALRQLDQPNIVRMVAAVEDQRRGEVQLLGHRTGFRLWAGSANIGKGGTCHASEDQ
jgi:serine/threonine protein kinase